MLDTESRFFKILCYEVKNIWAIYIWDKSREGRSVLCNSLIPSGREWSSKWNGILVNSEPNNKPELIQASLYPGSGKPGYHLPRSWKFSSDELIPVIPKPYTLSSCGHCIHLDPLLNHWYRRGLRVCQQMISELGMRNIHPHANQLGFLVISSLPSPPRCKLESGSHLNITAVTEPSYNFQANGRRIGKSWH